MEKRKERKEECHLIKAMESKRVRERESISPASIPEDLGERMVLGQGLDELFSLHISQHEAHDVHDLLKEVGPTRHLSQVFKKERKRKSLGKKEQDDIENRF